MNQTFSCSQEKCTISENGHCYLNNDPIYDCPNLRKSDAPIQKVSKTKSRSSKSPFWTGDFLKPDGLEVVSKSSSPQIIGVVGTADAGKTSYLGMLYTLLLNGRFLADHKFAGSLTLTGWEKLAYTLRHRKDGVLFPEATPSKSGFRSLYHLKLKTLSGMRELLFADASGEVFSQWGINRNDANVESARWIHINANAFILFIDCEALIERRAEAKEAILDIALQLKDNILNRPLAIAWSKADKIDDVRLNLKDSLKDELADIFGNNYSEFEVSNYTYADPDPKCHENNLAILNWLLQRMAKSSNVAMEMMRDLTSNDLFLNYR